MTFYNIPPSQVEQKRGQKVLVLFKPDAKKEPLEGFLFNIDPSSGTVILFEKVEEDSEYISQNEESNSKIQFTVIMNDSISSIQFFNELKDTTISEKNAIEKIDAMLSRAQISNPN